VFVVRLALRQTGTMITGLLQVTNNGGIGVMNLTGTLVGRAGYIKETSLEQASPGFPIGCLKIADLDVADRNSFSLHYRKTTCSAATPVIEFAPSTAADDRKNAAAVRAADRLGQRQELSPAGTAFLTLLLGAMAADSGPNPSSLEEDRAADKAQWQSRYEDACKFGDLSACAEANKDKLFPIVPDNNL
jgi:hypothetical protein